MSRLSRLLVALIATCLALVSTALPAHAAGNADAARKAGDYVASQAGSVGSNVGQAADSLLALAAAKDDAKAETAKQLLDVAKAGAADYSKDPQGAAKLALVAAAWGMDAKDFGGTDTIAATTAGIKEDGSFGQYPGPYASGMGILALARNKAEVPERMVAYLIQQANADGGFTYQAGQPSSADNTAMAILGLSAVKDAPGAQDALTKAQEWAKNAQGEDGSWAGYNKINSTAIMGSALQTVGVEQPRAVDYLVAQQSQEGWLPGDGGQPNLLATQQATLLLGDTSYATVMASPALGGPTPPPAPVPTIGGEGSDLNVIPIIVAIVALCAVAIFLFARQARARRAHSTELSAREDAAYAVRTGAAAEAPVTDDLTAGATVTAAATGLAARPEDVEEEAEKEAEGSETVVEESSDDVPAPDDPEAETAAVIEPEAAAAEEASEGEESEEKSEEGEPAAAAEAEAFAAGEEPASASEGAIDAETQMIDEGAPIHPAEHETEGEQTEGEQSEGEQTEGEQTGGDEHHEDAAATMVEEGGPVHPDEHEPEGEHHEGEHHEGEHHDDHGHRE